MNKETKTFKKVIKARKKRVIKKNKLEQERQKRKVSYARHREKRIAEASKWARDNSGKVNARNSHRRAAFVKAIPCWLTSSHYEEIQNFYLEAVKKGLQVDHIIPINGKTVCGLHVPWNLQLLSQTENCSKGNRYVD